MKISHFFGELTLFITKSLLFHSFLYLIGLTSPILSISLLTIEFIFFLQRLLR